MSTNAVLWRLQQAAEEELEAADNLRGELLDATSADERRHLKVETLRRQAAADSFRALVRRAVQNGHGDLELRSMIGGK